MKAGSSGGAQPSRAQLSLPLVLRQQEYGIGLCGVCVSMFNRQSHHTLYNNCTCDGQIYFFVQLLPLCVQLYPKLSVYVQLPILINTQLLNRCCLDHKVIFNYCGMCDSIPVRFGVKEESVSRA